LDYPDYSFADRFPLYGLMDAVTPRSAAQATVECALWFGARTSFWVGPAGDLNAG